MIFLVKFHRETQHSVEFREFGDDEREAAEDARRAIELSLGTAGMEYEVVLLEAVSESALRRTHSRYFPGHDPMHVGDAIRSGG